ncbi:tyrosinase family protein [Actinoplanes sp. NPDC051861]|uniref:tyrosinase family protein n=1 Tax=Actinoplanes sp. NPDC051861 TaxID=3155170 RepID=UPI003428A3FB
MAVRRNFTTMNQAERDLFTQTLRTFKTTPAASGRTYNWYIDQHVTYFARTPDNISHAHQSPSFFPWHREYLRLLELDLQSVANNTNLFIPYWDWTISTSPFVANFLGTTGPSVSGNFSRTWGWSVYRSSISTNNLQRRVGQNASRPTTTNVNTVQNNYATYDNAPWNSTVSNSYRNRNEIELHNRVHNYVGGHMATREAPNDPAFWLHHCNIDRLWWRWQSVNNGSRINAYRPTGGTANVIDVNDTMQPFGQTPASVANNADIGVSYV